MTLICEHHENGVQKANKGERREERNKVCIKEILAEKVPDRVPSNHTSD